MSGKRLPQQKKLCRLGQSTRLRRLNVRLESPGTDELLLISGVINLTGGDFSPSLDPPLQK